MSRRWLNNVLRTAIVAGCLAYAFWDVELAELGQTLLRYDPWRVGAAFFLGLAGYIVLAARLSTLLDAASQSTSLWMTFQASIFGLGMNNLLPARLGEIAKVIYLRNRAGLDSARLLGSVFWERFADIHALLGLAVLIVLMVDETRALGPLLAVVGVGWLGLIILRLDPGWVNRLLGKLPHPKLRAFASDLAVHLRSRMGTRAAASLGGLTIVLWTFYCAQVFIVVAWVAGIDVTPTELLVVFLVATLGMALPVSPGGIGVYESLFVLSLGWFGVAADEALAAGLTVHMIQYVPTTLYATAMLMRSGARPGSFADLRAPNA